MRIFEFTVTPGLEDSQYANSSDWSWKLSEPEKWADEHMASVYIDSEIVGGERAQHKEKRKLSH
jgi:hypothetical protein